MDSATSAKDGSSAEILKSLSKTTILSGGKNSVSSKDQEAVANTNACSKKSPVNSANGGTENSVPVTRKTKNGASGGEQDRPSRKTPLNSASGDGEKSNKKAPLTKHKSADKAEHRWSHNKTRRQASQGAERENYRRSTTGGGMSNRKSFDKGDKPRTSSVSNDRSSRVGNDNNDKRRVNSIKRSFTKESSTTSVGSEGYEYDQNFVLEEPFTDTDEDLPKGPKKLELNIPRGRIRTLSGTVPVVGYSPKWGGPTMCLSCLQFFDLPVMVREFADHLLTSHHIVVVEMDLIVDLKRYVEYWRQRFAKESINNIFPKIVPKEKEPYFDQTDYYYEMSEHLQEDYSLRQRLAMRRLEEALACQQREREDSNFSLQCIFCRFMALGNRAKLIHHLYMIHHLNLGSPDNLVFVTEYIEHLKEKLVRNECIYCEKTYPDRNTLMDHMRKRNHREVNPKNHYYDKFYIINYLELGKRWLDVLAEDFEDTMPTFVDSDDEEEQDSWHEWQEDNLDIDQTRVICLFCDESTDTIEPMLMHMKDAHGCDILDVVEKESLDLYQRMKMINFIRKQNQSCTCFVCGRTGFGSLQELRKHQGENNHLAKGLPDKSTWDIEENLVPIYGNDHLLWMLESYMDEKTITENFEETRTLTKEELSKELQKESEENTVPGVYAEDLPKLCSSVLADEELYESLK